MLNKLSNLGLYLPHIYFMGISIIIACHPNYMMIVAAIVLLVMIFIKNKILNVAVAAFLLFFSFWILLAYLSDFYKIIEFDAKAWKFIWVGALFIIANFSMSILMGLPFFKEQIDISESDCSVTGFQVQNSKI